MRRFLRILVRTVLGLLVLLVLAFFFRKPLFSGWLRERIESELTAALGAPVSVGALDGNWYLDLELVDVSMPDAPPDGPLAAFSVKRLHARYSLLDLLGDNPLEGVRGLTVEEADVRIDLTRPAAPPAIDDEADAIDPFELLPDEFPPIAVTGNIAVRWLTGDASAALDLKIEGQEVRLAARDIVAPRVDFTETQITIRRTGTAAFELATDAEMMSVSLEAARAERTGGGWNGAFTLRAGTGVVRASGGESAAELVIENVDLARFAELAGTLEGVVSGRVTWTAPASVSGELTASGIRAEGVEVDRAVVDVAFDDGRITLRTLSVERGAASIQARGIAIDLALPFKVARLEHARFHVPDLAVFGLDLPQPVRVTGGIESADGRTLRVRDLAIGAGRSELTLDGRATLPAAPEQWREATAELTVKGVLDGWSVWAPGAPAVSGAIRVSGDLSGTAAQPHATLALRGGPLVVEGRAVDQAVLTGELSWPGLDHLRLEARAGGDRILLRGAADLQEKALQEGEYEVAVGDLSKWVEGARGRAQGKGKVAWDGEALSGGGKLTVEALVVEERAIGDVSVSFRANGDVVSVEELRAGSVTARGRFDIQKREGVVAEASGRDWKLLAPLRVQLDADRESVAVNGLRVAAFGGTIEGAGQRIGTRIEATLTATRIDLARADARLRGLADLKATIAGDRVDVALHAPKIGFEELEGRVAFKARQDETGIVLTDLDAVLGDSLLAQGSGVLPWRFADGVWRETAVTPSLTLTLRCSDPRRWLGIEATRAEADISGDGPRLSASAKVWDWGPHAELKFEGETSVTARVGLDTASVKVATPPHAGANVQAGATLDRGLDWARPAAWRTAVDEARIDGAIDVELPDLGTLRRFAPDLRYLAGRATVRARVEGPLRTPKVNGEATLEDLAATLPDPLPPFQEGSARFVFDETEVRCEFLKGQLGYAPIRMSGTADREGIDVKLEGENTLLARGRHLRARADVALALKGTWDALALSGRVDVTDVLYSEPMNLFARGRAFADKKLQFFSLRTEPFASMTLDVDVRADDTVHLRNNVVRGAAGVHLRLLGTGAVPEPRGRITFRDTLVKLEFSSLKVDRGQLEFRPENPFAPRLDATAHTRMRGHDISVRVVGEVPDFEVQTNASPYLPPDDILLLLSVGLTREQLEGDGASGRVLKKAALLIGQRLYRRSRGPTDPDERSFLERFEFDMGRDVSRSGEDTVEAEFEINKRYYLRGERDRFDDYNLGFVWRFRFR